MVLCTVKRFYTVKGLGCCRFKLGVSYHRSLHPEPEPQALSPIPYNLKLLILNFFWGASWLKASRFCVEVRVNGVIP